MKNDTALLYEKVETKKFSDVMWCEKEIGIE